ncbi:AraC family transcriptional regulator [Tetragenococcus halophilus]|nr:AraC family transcriptional regulator [Tetragenococcus halophilus]
MATDYVEEIFLPIEDKEKQQLRTGKWVNEFLVEDEAKKYRQFRLENKVLFQESNIKIRKHRRFASYPKHSHQFLEFNYMYAGNSQQIVNGQQLNLREKQLLILDTNSSHSLSPLNKNDILINFLFKNENASIELLKNIDGRHEGMTYHYLMNAILEPEFNETHLLLDLSCDPEIQITLKQMILAFYNKNYLSDQILNAYTQVLFLQLSQLYHSQLAYIYPGESQNLHIIKVLQMIESDFSNLNLKSVADQLGFNPNYLSNLIRKVTGKTFTNLITYQRMKEAHHLLLATELPVNEIAEYVGFTNKSAFYKKFKLLFKNTPAKIRERNL